MKKNAPLLIFSFLILVGFGIGMTMLNVSITKKIDALSDKINDQKHSFDIVNKKIEDIQWYHIAGDIAYIDKVRLTGPPRYTPIIQNNAFLDSLANNDLVFHSYIFTPKTIDTNKKYPLIVFAHGGIHGTFSTVYAHVIRELICQGYIIVAPDYRGSTGYGRGFWRSIDYGGLENEDVVASRNYMVENYSFIDTTRVGIFGWSHGGMISLMNILKYPDQYTCAYAGVPVTDVIYRLSYQEADYPNLFSAKYHIGKTVSEAPEEYKRRSPVSYAAELKKPLMITTALNDDDVSVHEVQRMIDSLLYYNKSFEYKVYDALPGAHLFERIDTKESTDIRYKAYKFMEKYLKPANPFESEADLRRAGYRFGR